MQGIPGCAGPLFHSVAPAGQRDLQRSALSCVHAACAAGSSGQRRMMRAAMPGRCAWRGGTTPSSSGSTPLQTSPPTRRVSCLPAGAQPPFTPAPSVLPLANPGQHQVRLARWDDAAMPRALMPTESGAADSAGGQGGHALAHREGGHLRQGAVQLRRARLRRVARPGHLRGALWLRGGRGEEARAGQGSTLFCGGFMQLPCTVFQACHLTWCALFRATPYCCALWTFAR